jgi:serine/threonine protein kinase
MAGWSVPGVVHPREVREDPVGRRVVARHRVTRKSLAITYLSPELLVDTEFRTRFAHDFARVARIREAHVARVHRYLECDDGVAVIGEDAKGIPLRALLLAHGAVGIEAALVVFKDALLALAACHQAGLAHGDIKPEGVILTPAGQIRLVDFGLWTSDGRRVLARSTPFYLAPEQWSRRPADHAGDVYAATITFFECLVGAPPFYADSVAELSAKHERTTLDIDVVPEPVREQVLRGLAKDPRRRSDARSLLAHLGDVAARAAGSDWERRGRRELATLVANRSGLPDVLVPARRSGGWEDRKPVRLAAVMGGALALAAGLSSPPLAVILPGVSIFDPLGRSPVLAFPEPDHDSAPVRVVTNGPLADRALMPAPQAAAAGPVARARPPAPLISALKSRPAPEGKPVADGFHRGSGHRDGTAHISSTPDQSTPTPPECTQQPGSDPKPCTAVNPEQPPSGSAETTSNPSQVPIPVALPLPIAVPVSVQLPVPAPVEVPAPGDVPVTVQVFKPTPIRTKIQSHKDMDTPEDAQTRSDSQGFGQQTWTGPRDAPAKAGEQPTNWPQGNSDHPGSGSFGPGSSGAE